MKEVLKVSIGSWAFTLEQQAYDYLQAYLEQLQAQMQDLDSVEDKLGKYLSSQVKNVSQVVTLEQIQEAIQALGFPAFDTSAGAQAEAEEDNAAQRAASKVQQEMARHRLFRHPEQKVLGGVFGGWAAFLGWDAAVLRILYAVFLLVFLFAESIVFPILLLAYVAMWVAMPLARTQEQINQLYARPLGNQVVNDISQEVKQSQLGQFLSEFFRITFGIIFFLVGMTGLVIVPLCFLWLLPADILQFFDFMPLMPALGVSKVLFYICLFIPFLIFFYEGIKLLFKLSFKKFRLGLLLLIFWLVALIALAVSLAANVSIFGRSGTDLTTTYPIENQQDTLYISVDESVFADETYVCVLDATISLLWANPDHQSTLYALPSLKIIPDENIDELKIETSYHSILHKTNFDFLVNGRKMIEKEGEGLKIYPRVYNAENPWSLSHCKMNIRVPAHMTVVMDYVDDSKDCVLQSDERYFIFQGYGCDIDDDVVISTIDGDNCSSFDF